jgi:DNA mismatch repair protein MutS2
MAEVDSRFANASVEFDPESLAPSYRLTLGTAGSSSATAVAARMGMPAAVLERANALLEREDRRLDQMLTELSTSRGALARERSEAQRLRAEGEATRREYGEKLERLQARRDKLFEQMRAELDAAFRSAHREVADVIRDLQRGGSARDAALARERLLGLETRAIEVAEAAPKPPAPPRTPTDWSHAQPGDEVEMPGGRKGALVALPDRHGKVTVTVGTARMTLPAEQVVLRARRRTDAPEATRAHVRIETAPPSADAGQCDVRGMRVDEALDRLLAALDSAASAGRNQLLVVHGLGTGKLRAAVREHLAASPYVLRAEAPPGRKGGEGATLAVLKE